MAEKHHPYFGVPPARQPRPAGDEPALRGKRVILSTPEGFVYDVRAITQIYRDEVGDEVVDEVTEEDYYRWMLLQTPPVPTRYPSRLVWVE